MSSIMVLVLVEKMVYAVTETNVLQVTNRITKIQI